MHKLVKIFLIFSILFETNSLVFSQEEQPKSLDTIFDPYLSIVFGNLLKNEICDTPEQALQVTYRFFEDWNNLEYFKFLSRLNEVFIKKDNISEGDQVMLLWSELTEILGGRYIKREYESLLESDRNTYYIPEDLLDTLDTISLLKRGIYTISKRRHDGILVQIIDKDRILIYRVLEAKIDSDTYRQEQSRGVFHRWLNQGVFIADRLFEPRNVYIMEDYLSLLSYLTNKLKADSVYDFSKKEVLVYNTNILSEELKELEYTSAKLLYSVSRMIQSDLVSKDFDITLNSVNEAFIDRVLYLLKKYIQIYGKIPAIIDTKDLSFSIEKDSNEELMKKYEVFFENDKNRKDLILTLYSIYRNDTLFSIFKKRIHRFFTLDEIKVFDSKIYEHDIFTGIDLITNTEEKTIEALVGLLGGEYRAKIEEVVNKHHISTYNPSEELKENFEKLREYFKSLDLDNFDLPQRFASEVQSENDSFSDALTKFFVLSNLQAFILMNSSKMDIYLHKLRTLRKLVSSNLECYIIISAYFNLDSVGLMNLSQSLVNMTRRVFSDYLSYHASNFEIICFIFENEFAAIECDALIDRKPHILKSLKPIELEKALTEVENRVGAYRGNTPDLQPIKVTTNKGNTENLNNTDNTSTDVDCRSFFL